MREAAIAYGYQRRAKTAAQSELDRGYQKNNGEVEVAPYCATFTKGLAHDEYGVVKDLAAVDIFKVEISQQLDPAQPDTPKQHTPFPDRPGNDIYPKGVAAAFDVPHPDMFRQPVPGGGMPKWRGWESPLAGHTFELEGPDCDTLAMPEAPKLGSDELTAEIAELYAMALLRDVPFQEFETGQAGTAPTPSGMTTNTVIAALNQLPWFNKVTAPDIQHLTPREIRRREARFLSGETALTRGSLFRGSTAGPMTGPWISQFLLIGSTGRGPGAGCNQMPLPQAAAQPPQQASLTCTNLAPGGGGDVTDGLIRYGAQTITQYFIPHLARVDHMTDLTTWLDVQDGADRKKIDCYADAPRFIHTPRDLATYVHFDALYQGYLNACLILLSMDVPADRGLPEGMGNSTDDTVRHKTRDAFATFGTAQILSLVTEVATRALKAARRQKFQIHLRGRPEAVAGGLTLAGLQAAAGGGKSGVERMGPFGAQALAMADALPMALKNGVNAHNLASNTAHGTAASNGWIDMCPHNLLLPMAFPEGSPMHPSYAAGHATVAGACVTILKAFFELYGAGPFSGSRGETKLSTIVQHFENDATFGDLYRAPSLMPHACRTSPDGSHLVPYAGQLTIEGELDKLAANISVGRNFAGVHYYTDYYESLRMGERIAVGILQEQMLTYREPLSMRFRSFDGDYMLLTGTGGSLGLDDAVVHVRGADEGVISFDKWWHRAGDESGWTRG
ncbi:MAG: bromoperoxidase [Fulvimarina sp.]|nr:bromoperoxidase [Fulvimarina sp.]